MGPCVAPLVPLRWHLKLRTLYDRRINPDWRNEAGTGLASAEPQVYPRALSPADADLIEFLHDRAGAITGHAADVRRRGLKFWLAMLPKESDTGAGVVWPET